MALMNYPESNKKYEVGMAVPKATQNKDYRDINHIHYTSLHLLFNQQ
jgi:hypothetical protein